MDTIKDRNRMDLQEKEDIKKRWQDYIELYKKYLNENLINDVLVSKHLNQLWVCGHFIWFIIQSTKSTNQGKGPEVVIMFTFSLLGKK